jgi:hypothetical protein
VYQASKSSHWISEEESAAKKTQEAKSRAIEIEGRILERCHIRDLELGIAVAHTNIHDSFWEIFAVSVTKLKNLANPFLK